MVNPASPVAVLQSPGCRAGLVTSKSPDQAMCQGVTEANDLSSTGQRQKAACPRTRSRSRRVGVPEVPRGAARPSRPELPPAFGIRWPASITVWNELALSRPPDMTMPRRPGSAGTVDVSPMLDANDDNFGRLVANSVEHPVGSTAGRPQAGELSTQWSSNPSGLLHQRGREELKHGSGDALGKLISQGSTGGGCEDELVATLFAHRRSCRTASTPRTTSPRA